MPKAKSKRRKTSKNGRLRARGAALSFAAGAGVCALTGLGALAALIAYYAHDLPGRDGLWSESRPSRVTLIAADGAPIPLHGQTVGAPVRLAELPRHVPLAILAVEDRNFRHHVGFNPVSVVRALITNVSEGEVQQGASTITQQLAKNLFLRPDKTLKRKVQELILAIWLEERFTKDQILTLYLNRVYFGAGAYGVDAAAHRYFDKSAHELSVAEAALLAGLLKAPSRYSPRRNPADAAARGGLVLEQMVAAGFLSRRDAAAARAEPIVIVQPRFAAAPYFADHALREAAELAQGVDADLIIETTFDPRVQAALETGLSAGLSLVPLDDAVETAAVILDQDGAVRAMIGGRDYRKSQFNRASQARRQPGSAFKPIVFLAALERGLDPAAQVLDAPISIGAWSPRNYKDQFFGSVSATDALARSLNSVAVRLQEQAGRQRVRQLSRRLGLSSVETAGPALALGVDAVTPVELAGAYAALANGGWRSPAHAVTRIRTADGQVIYERPAPALQPAASSEAVAKLDAMLGAVVEYGTGRKAQLIGYRAAGKTGTTQEGRDAWFAGYAGGLAGVVWVGRDDNLPVEDSLGGHAPAVIWREAMQRALEATIGRRGTDAALEARMARDAG